MSNSSNYKLEFTLKQHTPIIHFQADQKGATLRATELKPKLDRFLIDKLKMLDENKKPLDKYKSWFIGEGKQHLALDYKVRIEYSGNLKYYIPYAMSLNSRNYPQREQSVITYLRPTINIDDFISPTLFFSNADKIKFQYQSNQVDDRKSKIDELAYAIQSEGHIECSIISYNTELLQNIEIYIHHFFAKENFGTRQNKGFGCFEVVSPESSKTYEELLKDNYSVVYKYTVTYDSDNFSEIFEKIKNDYTHLKSGLNHGGYKKSKLFQYFAKDEENPIRWEKRKIKKILNNHLYEDNILMKNDNKKNNDPIYNATGEQSWSDTPSEYNYAYIRALLGVSDKFEFGIYNPDNPRYAHGSKKYLARLSNERIKRFKSPITFKVHSGTIYLVADDFDNTLFQKKCIVDEQEETVAENFLMKFYFVDGRREVSLSGATDLTLSLPTNFNIDSFLHYALSEQESIQNWENLKRSNHEQ